MKNYEDIGGRRPRLDSGVREQRKRKGHDIGVQKGWTEETFCYRKMAKGGKPRNWGARPRKAKCGRREFWIHRRCRVSATRASKNANNASWTNIAIKWFGRVVAFTKMWLKHITSSTSDYVACWVSFIGPYNQFAPLLNNIMQNLTSEKINLLPLCVKTKEVILPWRVTARKWNWKKPEVETKDCSLHVHTPVVTSLENNNQNNLKLIQIKVQRSTLFKWILDLEPSY